jgi:glutamine synthetase adenylyltransferase
MIQSKLLKKQRQMDKIERIMNEEIVKYLEKKNMIIGSDAKAKRECFQKVETDENQVLELRDKSKQLLLFLKLKYFFIRNI